MTIAQISQCLNTFSSFDRVAQKVLDNAMRTGSWDMAFEAFPVETDKWLLLLSACGVANAKTLYDDLKAEYAPRPGEFDEHGQYHVIAVNGQARTWGMLQSYVTMRIAFEQTIEYAKRMQPDWMAMHITADERIAAGILHGFTRTDSRAALRPAPVAVSTPHLREIAINADPRD